ncbi:dihydrofolate reductase family protein [Frondihabitans cladoniiphilus]|uniref:Dihydrofolate reductase family protein n=1 Tax=Frondihabitans cladoniiphilus TaxID=715785 RepID=A0ABP8W3M9_9MICO
MATIVAVEYITLDGVFEEPAWSGPYFGEELGTFQWNNLFGADALLLGRVTYEGFSEAWPQMEETTGDFGKRMNSMPKYVATSSRKPLTWNATALSDSGENDVVEAIKKLRAESEGVLLLNGSADLFNMLSSHGLVDEYRFMIFPVVVGRGKKLWAKGVPEQALTLTNSDMTKEGVAVLTYVPAAPAAE